MYEAHFKSRSFLPNTFRQTNWQSIKIYIWIVYCSLFDTKYIVQHLIIQKLDPIYIRPATGCYTKFPWKFFLLTLLFLSPIAILQFLTFLPLFSILTPPKLADLLYKLNHLASTYSLLRHGGMCIPALLIESTAAVLITLTIDFKCSGLPMKIFGRRWKIIVYSSLGLAISKFDGRFGSMMYRVLPLVITSMYSCDPAGGPSDCSQEDLQSP